MDREEGAGLPFKTREWISWYLLTMVYKIKINKSKQKKESWIIRLTDKNETHSINWHEEKKGQTSSEIKRNGQN